MRRGVRDEIHSSPRCQSQTGVSPVNRTTPRRRRLSLWATLYLALTGATTDDESDTTAQSPDRR